MSATAKAAETLAAARIAYRQASERYLEDPSRAKCDLMAEAHVAYDLAVRKDFEAREAAEKAKRNR